MPIKNIYAMITNHVQMVGYREIVEIHAKARGLSGFVFNDIDGSVKLMASGQDVAIDGFFKDLKIQRPDTVIKSVEILEDIILPSPFGRIVIDEMREISDRLDKGNTVLCEMNTKLDKLNVLDEISGKLDTLPEKIAEALKK